MKRRRTLWFLIIAFIVLVSVDVLAAAVPKPVLKANDSVIRIITSYSDGTMASGSGFVISSDKVNTYIITNHHVAVMDNPTYISVILNSEAEINASVVASDENRDLAVLKVAMPLSMDPLKLSKESAKKGDGIYVIGFPGDADFFTDSIALNHEDTTITDGIVSALRNVSITGTGDPIDLIQISAAINHGNSGGPVIDMKGQVVGVSTFTMGATSIDINGAVSVTEIASFLQENKISYSTGAAGLPFNPMLIVGAVIAVAAILIIAFIIKRRKTTISFVGISEDTLVPESTAGQAAPAVKVKKPFVFSKKIIPVIVAVAMIAICAFGVSGYNNAIKAVEAGDLNSANPFFLQLAGTIDKQFAAYTDAVKLLNYGDYDSAEQAFSALDGYRNSDVMVLECRYRKGKQLIAEQNFKEAQVIFTELGDYSDAEDMIKEAEYQRGQVEVQKQNYDGAINIYKQLAHDPCYKDSDVMVKDVRFQKAMHLYDSERYFSACLQMKELADEGYQKALDALPIIKETTYNDAIASYRENNTLNLEKTFMMLDDYKDSGIYLRLSKIKDGADTKEFLHERNIAVQYDQSFLLDNIGFEDAAQLLLWNNAYAETFLTGSWSTLDRQYYFEMRNNSTWYNLPSSKEGSTYFFNQGKYIVSAGEQLYDQFLFEVVDKNTIDVYCYGNRRTYTLYRD